MSTKNKSKSSQKKSLPVHRFSENPVLLLSDKICSQINFLHRKIGSDEWSGILLYSHKEGDIENADELILVAEELYLMDIGSPGYTEYINDVDSILYLADNYPRYTSGELKIGHIHSHHNMGTGFSATDMDELQDNSPAHNYYLSLIVNFKCKPTAKISTVCEIEERTISHPGAKGSVKKSIPSQKFLGVYDVIVSSTLEQKFLDRYSLVKKEKEEEEKRKKAEREKKSATGKKYPSGVNQTVKNWNPYGNQFEEEYSDKDLGQQRMKFDEPDFSDHQIDEFIYKWFNLNPYIGSPGNVEDAVGQIEFFMESADKQAEKEFVDALEAEYEEFALQIVGGNMYFTDDEFLKLTKIVIQKLEPYESRSVIKDIINTLQIYEETLIEMIEEDD